nr:MAG TPA: transmembrane protein [Caudoviricetes sp.]
MLISCHKYTPSAKKERVCQFPLFFIVLHAIFVSKEVILYDLHYLFYLHRNCINFCCPVVHHVPDGFLFLSLCLLDRNAAL